MEGSVNVLVRVVLFNYYLYGGSPNMSVNLELLSVMIWSELRMYQMFITAIMKG